MWRKECVASSFQVLRSQEKRNYGSMEAIKLGYGKPRKRHWDLLSYDMDYSRPGLFTFYITFSSSQGRTEEISLFGSDWQTKAKHIFILSDAGKPIYSHHGDEDELSSLMAVMQVNLSFLVQFYSALSFTSQTLTFVKQPSLF